MNKPRLSMKLLWKFREDFVYAGAIDFKPTQATKNAAEETRRFLNFVESTQRSPHATQPKVIKQRIAKGAQE